MTIPFRRCVAPLAFGFLLTVSALASHPFALRLTTPCDSPYTHGEGTDSLCSLDALPTSAYIESANGDYRLFFQSDGALILFDVSGESWVNLRTFNEAFTSPGHVVYDWPSHEPEWSRASLVTYDDSDDVYSGIWFDEFNAPSGDHFVRIDNDGCLRFYDEGGTHVRGEYCGS